MGILNISSNDFDINIKNANNLAEKEILKEIYFSFNPQAELYLRTIDKTRQNYYADSNCINQDHQMRF